MADAELSRATFGPVHFTQGFGVRANSIQGDAPPATAPMISRHTQTPVYTCESTTTTPKNSTLSRNSLYEEVHRLASKKIGSEHESIVNRKTQPMIDTRVEHGVIERVYFVRVSINQYADSRYIQYNILDPRDGIGMVDTACHGCLQNSLFFFARHATHAMRLLCSTQNCRQKH